MYSEATSVQTRSAEVQRASAPAAGCSSGTLPAVSPQWLKWGCPGSAAAPASRWRWRCSPLRGRRRPQWRPRLCSPRTPWAICSVCVPWNRTGKSGSPHRQPESSQTESRSGFRAARRAPSVSSPSGSSTAKSGDVGPSCFYKPAISHSVVQVRCDGMATPAGVSLLAMRAYQATSLVDVMPLSRASFAPTVISARPVRRGSGYRNLRYWSSIESTSAYSTAQSPLATPRP